MCIWSEENIRVKASNYNTKTEFKENCSKAYRAALKLKIINDLGFKVLRKPKNFWTESVVKKEADKYKTKLEFKENAKNAYAAAIRLGIIDNLGLKEMLKPKKYWHKEENIRKEVAKYKTKTEFSKGCSGAYQMALKLGIIDDLGFELKGDLYNRCIYAIEFEDNHVYIGLTCNIDKRIKKHFRNPKKSSAGKYYLKSGSKYKTIKLTDYINVEKSGELENFYIEKYRSENWIILNKAKAGGLGKSNSKWTKELVLEESLKYENPTEFHISNSSAYNYARSNKFTHELVYSEPREVNIKWDLEKVLDVFLRYENYTDIMNSKDKTAYYYAQRNNLLNIIKYKNHVSNY